MNDREDIDMLAAEFVLGTLSAEERIALTARSQREPELAQAIASWEQRLAPLNSHVKEVAPRSDLLESILAQLDAPEEIQSPAVVSALEVEQLRARARRWQFAAIAASIVALLLAGFIGLNERFFQPTEQQYVAVFNERDEKPLFVLSIDLASKRLTIRPVGAQSAPDKDYELWIVSERLGPTPRSLGLLEDTNRITRKPLQISDPDLLTNATFGISLEPAGGSPTGTPTGPAIHGKLLPSTE